MKKHTYFTIVTLFAVCLGNSIQAMQGTRGLALAASTAIQSLKSTFTRTFSTGTRGLGDAIDHQKPNQAMIIKHTNKIKALTAQSESLDQRYAYTENMLNDAYENRNKLTNAVMRNTCRAMDLFPTDGRKKVTLGSRLAKNFKDGLMPGSPIENAWDNIYAIFHNNYRDLIPLITFFHPSVTIWKSEKYKKLTSKDMVALDALENKLFKSLSLQEPSSGDTRILERDRRALNEQLMHTIIERATLRAERLSIAQALKTEQAALEAELLAQTPTASIDPALLKNDSLPSEVSDMAERILENTEIKAAEQPKQLTPKDERDVAAAKNYREYHF